jgi:hypothetical protein
MRSQSHVLLSPYEANETKRTKQSERNKASETGATG